MLIHIKVISWWCMAYSENRVSCSASSKLPHSLVTDVTWILHVSAWLSIALWIYVLYLKELTEKKVLMGLLYCISSDKASLIEFISFSCRHLVLSYSYSRKTWASILSTFSCRSTRARRTWATTFACRPLKKMLKFAARISVSYWTFNCLFKLNGFSRSFGVF